MMSKAIELVSVNISAKRDSIKHPVTQAEIDERGIIGDAHAGTAALPVSLLAQESIERFTRETGRKIAPGEFAENLTIRGLDPREVGLLDHLQVGVVELQVAQIGKRYHEKPCAIYREVGRCLMPEEGIFCRVTQNGTVRVGDAVQHMLKLLRFKVITVSDRASRGEYADRSGPRVRELIEDFMKDKRWHFNIDASIVSDDPEKLANELRNARNATCDVVITTGGTGVGARDTTPEVVVMECSKLIPGIMEHIRVKYGAENPAALLSRSVAGVLGHGLVFTLPGSVKAVEEYMNEILKTIEHLIMMLHGLDIHQHP